MPGSKSDYLEEAMLKHVLGGPDYQRPGTVYVALYTVDPTDAGGGTEVSGGGYARASISNTAAAWSPAGKNANAISFPTATEDWGEVVAFGLLDAATGGNLLYWGELTTPRMVSAGQSKQFGVGALAVTED